MPIGSMLEPSSPRDISYNGGPCALERLPAAYALHPAKVSFKAS